MSGPLRTPLEIANARIGELGAENATLREQLTGMWQRLAEVAGVEEQPADCSTDEAWLVLFMKLSEVMSEGARELAQAHADVQLVAAQGVAALADLHAEHARERQAAYEAMAAVQDNLSELQSAARGAL